jgi:hypothetical protein
MPKEPDSQRRYPLLTALTALIVAIAGLAPLVTAVKSLLDEGKSQKDALGAVFEKLSDSWLCGGKQIFGVSSCAGALAPEPSSRAIAASSPVIASAPAPAPARVTCTSTTTQTTGLLERNIPISDIAGWCLPKTQFPRAIYFDLRVEARAEEVDSRASLITLEQDGSSVCSYRFDVGARPSGTVVHVKQCNQEVLANEAHVYTVKIEPVSRAISVTMNVIAQRPH